MAPPASKLIPGTAFLVDGFKFAEDGIRAYFLTHAHSDHYTGLTDAWDKGPIYCSGATARLIKHMLGVDQRHLCPLPINMPQNVDGVEVTLIDANHCPGAVQFLFQLPNGKKFIHCGDMRFCREMLSNPFLKRFQGANSIFLDTTYCNPKHTFPAQEESVDYVANTISQFMKEESECGQKHLFMISTYGIGKERILLKVHQQCGIKIHVSEQKYEVMRCVDFGEMKVGDIFTTDPVMSNVHVVKWGVLGDVWPYFRPNFVNMEAERVRCGATKVVGFVPTGWVHHSGKSDFPVYKKNDCEVHLVPYSEHSSYSELREFVREMRPEKIIPTVGADGEDGEIKEASMLKHFHMLVNETASKARFIQNMTKKQENLEKKEERSGFGIPPERFEETSLKDVVEVRASIVTTERGSEGLEKTGMLDVSQGRCAPEERNEPSRDVGSGIPRHNEAEGEQEIPAGEILSCSGEVRMDIGKTECCDEGEKWQEGRKDADQVESALGEDAMVLPSTACENMRSSDRSQLGKRKARTMLGGNLVKEENLSAFEDDMGREEGSIGDDVEQMVSILSGNISKEAAEELLTRAGGKLEVAINLFYEARAAKHVVGKLGSQKRKGAKRAAFKVNATPSRKHARRSAGQRSISSYFSPVGSPAKRVRGRVIQRSICSYFTPVKSPSIPKKEDPIGPLGLWGSGREFGTPDGGNQYGLGFLAHWNGAKEEHTPPGKDISGCKFDKWEGSIEMERGADARAFSETTVQDGSGSDRGEQSRNGCEGNLVMGEGVKSEMLPCALKSFNSEGGNRMTDLSESDLLELFQNFPGKAEEGWVDSSYVDEGFDQTDRTLHPSLDGSSEDEEFIPLTPLGDGPDIPENAAAVGSKEELRAMKAGSGGNHGIRKDAVLKSLCDYDPEKDACWVRGEAPPYLHLARALQAVISTTKRLKICDGLTNMFRSVLVLSPEHLMETVYLACGKVASDHSGVELNVGANIVSAAICEATGANRSKLRALYAQEGDLGDVAQACGQSQRRLLAPEPLTLPGVFRRLKTMALEKGAGSVERRKRVITAMLRACRECETRILVRTLIQNMRIGASWRSVVGALGRASLLHVQGPSVTKSQLDEAASSVCEAYHMCPCFEVLVPALIDGGVDEAKKRCTLIPGVPVKPMLAKISSGVKNALSNLQGADFLAEFKYDGMRAQIHLDPNGEVSIFSRNCETRTGAFPDVASGIRKAMGSNVSSIVLDAELVAIDRGQGNRLMAFQDLSHRQRGSVAESDVKIAVCTFVFDILYLNGELLAKQSLRERRRAMTGALANLEQGAVEVASSLEIRNLSWNADGEKNGPCSIVKQEECRTGVVPSEDCKDVRLSIEDQVYNWLLCALSNGAEGLMLKELDGPSSGYESSKRSDHWLKIKSDYCDGLHDSLDVVPIGAWRGNGRKVKWFSPFLLAIWDPVQEEFQSICRCMSGFSDTFYEEATARLSKKAIPSPRSYYRTRDTPSIWFEPCEVWEIKGADLTLSPVHQAAIGRIHESKGLGLRFPRFTQVRQDKDPMDATTHEEVADMFTKQICRMATTPEEAKEVPRSE